MAIIYRPYKPQQVMLLPTALQDWLPSRKIECRLHDDVAFRMMGSGMPQELGGWASYAMVQRYAHLAADHLAPRADRLTESRTRRGTNLAQPAVAQRLTTHEEPASL
jgi:hypothetical protein